MGLADKIDCGEEEEESQGSEEIWRGDELGKLRKGTKSHGRL